MATGSTDALPRLADALSDVGTRLRQISDELRTIHEDATDVAAAEVGKVPGQAPADQAATSLLNQPADGMQSGQFPADSVATSALGQAPTSPRSEQVPGTHSSQVPTDSAAASLPYSTPAGQHSGTQSVQATPQPYHPVAGSMPGALPGQQQSGFPAGQQGGHPGRPTGEPQVPWYPPHVPPPPAPPTLWDRLSQDGAGSRLLAWAGGVVTIAGVVLLLVLAIQRGLLGPLPRVVIGAVLAFGLVGVGLRLHRTPAARIGANALVATGFVGLYLDVIAATTLYEYLPPWAGLLAGLVVAGLGVAVSRKWDSQQLAVFVVVCCAVSAPILTQGFGSLLLGFLLVLTLATAPVHLGKRWPSLALASGIPPVVAELVRIGLASDGRLAGTEVAVTAVVTTAALIGLTTVAALRGDDDQTFVLFLLSPLPAVFAAGLLPVTADALLPGVTTVLLVAVWMLRARLPRRFALAAGGLATITGIQATATALGGDVRTLVLLGAGLVLGLLAVRLRDTTVLVPAVTFGGIGFLASLGTPTPPSALFRPESVAVTFGPGGLLIAATAVTLGWAAQRRGVATRPLLITAAGVTLYGAATAVLSIGLLISPDRTGFLVGHTLVTVSWTIGALVLLTRGIDLVTARVAGLALVGAALAKLVLFDLSSLDGMARVAAFLVAGLILLGAGTRYARLVAGRAD